MQQYPTLETMQQYPTLETVQQYLIFETVQQYCTNEILISDVNSAKNSLAIIYMCLKMHCLKYVVNFILFYSCGPGVAI